MWRVRDFSTLHPKWNIFINILPQSRFRDLWGKGGRKILRARSVGWLKGNNVFQTYQDWCTCALPESVTAHTRLYKFKSEKNIPAQRSGSGQKVSPQPRSHFQLLAFGKGKIAFPRWSVAGFTNLTPRKTPCSGVVGQHGTYAVFLSTFSILLGFCFAWFLFVCFDLHSLFCYIEREEKEKGRGRERQSYMKLSEVLGEGK